VADPHAAQAPQAAELSSAAYLRLVALGAVVGIPAALLAAVFLAVVHEGEHLLWHTLPHHLGYSSPPWFLILGLPVAGAALVIAARRLLPGDGGHPPLDGIGGGVTPIAYAPGVALAAIGTLCFGAVLGPEAPLIALGAVAGLVVATVARRPAGQGAVLAAAGSFSAISSLFGGPIVGGMMMVEGGVAMGEKLIPTLLPGFAAAAIGYVLFVGLGDWGGIQQPGLVEPGLPDYHGTSVRDQLIGLAVGVLAALLIGAVKRASARLAQEGPPRIGLAPLLLAGGLATGFVALVAQWLGADSQDVLFSGQSSVPALVATGTTGIVLVLLAGKALGYAIAMGSGFRGGPVFPAIFIGVAIATLPVVWWHASPTLAVAVGTAAGMAATSRLILTPIVFSALLVGRHGLDTEPAAVLAAVAAWLTVTALERRGATDSPEPAG
jgi:H+/Cl- antiporter ClcA